MQLDPERFYIPFSNNMLQVETTCDNGRPYFCIYQPEQPIAYIYLDHTGNWQSETTVPMVLINALKDFILQNFLHVYQNNEMLGNPEDLVQRIHAIFHNKHSDTPEYQA
jgi:hypothetical protein